MLIKFFNNEVCVQRCLFGWFMLPRIGIVKADLFFSWLGGCIVWSRVNKTHKDIRRVQEDRPLDSGTSNLRFPAHRTRSIRNGKSYASDGHWRTHGHN
jgi:hypothetical protein